MQLILKKSVSPYCFTHCEMVDYELAYNKIWSHFRQITPFSKEEFDKLAALTTFQTLKKGDVVYKQGSIPSYGGYINQGALRYFYTPPMERREVTTSFQFEETCFGDGRTVHSEAHATSLLLQPNRQPNQIQYFD